MSGPIVNLKVETDIPNLEVKTDRDPESSADPALSIKSEASVEDPRLYNVKAIIEEGEKLGRAAITKLLCVSLVCILFMSIEIVGGILASSLAILTDAAHLFSDFSGFALSIISLFIGRQPATKVLSYGYGRAEVIGALTSIMIIWVLTIWLVYEAIGRIINPQEVDGKLMFLIACMGFVCNLIMMRVLHSHGHDHGHDHGHSHGHDHSHSHAHKDHDHVEKPHKTEHKHDHDHDDDHDHDYDETKGLVDKKNKKKKDDHDHDHDHEEKQKNLNVEAAFIHVFGDMIQSIGVIIAGAIIWIKPEWHIADPICTFLFSILVILTTVGIAKECLRTLMEGVPKNIDHEQFERDLAKLPDVVDVHDLHIWSLSAGKMAMSAHLSSTNPAKSLKKATSYARKHKIYHSTLQVEMYDPKKPIHSVY